ncbi:hypothetical protein O3G_MSEX004578 [Manduca sexta]|uniref:NodB homology domain-containing protein n=1 Tax=Manduca sexta TaxID=7130 RepID=A0A921YVR7_MANSE|nr:hypothetical protein O3G_MSEX004578 [Manduca sexta]
MEYVEVDPESLQSDDFERGKRQVRYYLKNGFKNPGKNWAIANPVKLVDLQQAVYNPNIQNFRYQPNFSGVGNNNYYNDGRQQFSYDNNLFTTANPFLSYQGQNAQSERPFKPSLPDPGSQKFYHNSANSATHIITKSPPISSLKNNGNPFSSLNGGFYNNSPRPITNQNSFSPQGTVNRPNNQASYQDSSLLPSTIVTGKPVQMAPPSRPQNSKQNEKQPVDDDYDEDSEESDSSSEEDEDDRFRHDFPKPPYEFTHPNHKYADIENPFANPNFDFDAFLSKISNGQYQQNPKIVQNIQRPHPTQNMQISSVKASAEVTTSSNRVAPLRSSTLDYKGMSTPTPFTYSHNPSSTLKPDENNLRSQKLNQQYHQFSTPQPSQQTFPQQQQQQQSFNKNVFSKGPQQTAGIPLEAVRPKLNPPNFRDDRQLPITYSFSTQKPYYEQSKIKGENPQIFSVSSKPYVVVAGTSQPILLSTPKQQYNVKPEKIISLPPHLVSTGKPYILSSVKPQNSFIAFKQSTPKPLTTIVNEQLSALQHYWSNPSTQNPYSVQSVTMHPSSSPDTNKLQNLFAPANKPSNQAPIKSQNMFVNIVRDPITTTTAPSKRRPIPKPSPEMNDYYYDDDDEQYYYEPAVKPKYMPSTEVKPQRPAMAQNYKEYDNYEDLDEGNDKPTTPRKPVKYTSLKPETVTKNHNDVSIVTKSPPKDDKNGKRKIPVPVLVDYSKPTNVLIRPEVSNYQIIHHPHRNRTIPNMRKPVQPESSPYTNRPPKYLNQTTLRPYTVRHRLAKPTPVPVKQVSIQNNKPTTERVRHPNIVAQMKLTTLRDSYNQETRFTKTKHDDKTNSLEPTESVAPISYSASPRPKMLYNGSQNYNPDQYDPYYAVYDEDGELYKDTDYVQQYNIASVRPVVQQTYRGTPPPARRPVETYTPRPVTSDDYDDALIQGQISNQNQYQSPVRHSTRGEGNELGYDHNPSSVRTTLYEATTISTTPRTTSTSTTTTTTQRSTTAPYTEAMTPSRYTPRPTSTRGRGSAHYSTSSGSESSQPAPNRGTPPTRSRPTLKPSTAIVSKTTEFVDIYAHPPSRPAPVYPQPTPDKTAAKCRKDVCLLPDCYCGGKDIPGKLPVNEVPQMVLITFDDAVNDLNKIYYEELLQKGRVNPNGCPITATFYVSHEWTDYSQVQNLYADGHEFASHTISHSFGEQFSQKKWNREVAGQREILAAYGGVKLEDVRGMRAPFLSVGGNKMFKMLYDSNFTYDSSLPVYENKPPSWPYTLDYKLFHDCMIPPCPTKSYPGVWEVPMVMWQDLNGGRCSMGDACANPPEAENVYKMILKNFDRHYTTNRAPFGLFYHAAWFTQPHHKEGFIMFLDFINQMPDVWIVTNWQALQWVRDPTPISRLNNFQPFQCNYQDRPKKCNNPKVCNLWHKSGVRYMRTCQPCPEVYPWTGKSGIRSSRIDNDIGE